MATSHSSSGLLPFCIRCPRLQSLLQNWVWRSRDPRPWWSRIAFVARSYRPVDRDQAFLLPPLMTEWLPEDHLAWFLVDVAFRVICAQDAPDHTTIARFRADHEAAFTDLFEQVLIVCAKAGLGRVGVIAVDGTKIAANASVDANRTEDRLRAEVERIVAAAAKTDAAEDAEYGDARGDELPTEMAEATGRVARIRACLTQIDAEKATVAADRAAADAKAAARLQAARDRVARAEQEARAKTEAYQAAWAATGRRPNGRGPTPPEDSGKVQRARDALVKAERRDSDRVTRLQARDNAAAKTPSCGAPRRNVTDPDSRIMPTRRGWIQGYNAQLAVTDDHLILATRLTQDTVDLHQCQPMI